MCTHLATMSAHESGALISYFSAAACHQHSYQKYIPEHNHRRTGCQNTSEHMSTIERWEREREACGGCDREVEKKIGQRDDTGLNRGANSMLSWEIFTNVLLSCSALLKIDAYFTPL